MTATETRPSVLDLFSGAGGMSLGFQQAGFDIVAAVEMMPEAAATHRLNFPVCQVIEGDIRDEQVKHAIREFQETQGIDVIIGGFPCQGFSMAGDRNPLDPRGQLYKEYLAVVAMVRPRMFVMENVKGLTSMKVLPEPLDDETRKKVEMIQRHRDLKRCRAQRSLDEQEEEEFQKLEKRQVALKREIKGKLVDLLPRIMKEIKELGYVVDWRVLNAVDHGSPQSRQRVFIVARREDLDLEFSFPEPIPEEDRMTVKEAIGHLESVRDGEVSNHDFTRHSNDMRDRLSRLPQGQNLYPRFRDSWWRLMPDQPSRTVKENHGGVFIHYDQPRALTPRELACLQDFPDDFAFAGCKSKVLVQVGNAVPVKLARAVARSARVTLETRK